MISNYPSSPPMKSGVLCLTLSARSSL